MLVIANNANNVIGLGVADVFDLAHLISESDTVVILDDNNDADEVIFLSAVSPILSGANWQANQIVTGVVNLSINATDIIGLNSVMFNIGELSFLAPDLSAPSLILDTLQLADGLYDVVVSAESKSSVKTEFTRTILIANQGLTISNLRPQDLSFIRGSYVFGAQVSDPVGVESVNSTIDEENSFYPENLSSPSMTVDTTTLETGVYEFTVDASSVSNVSA